MAARPGWRPALARLYTSTTKRQFAPAVVPTSTLSTERLQIGYAVMLPALRQPLRATKQIASLQYVSSNRLLLGVGVVGVSTPDKWRAFADRARAGSSQTPPAPSITCSL